MQIKDDLVDVIFEALGKQEGSTEEKVAALNRANSIAGVYLNRLNLLFSLKNDGDVDAGPAAVGNGKTAH